MNVDRILETFNRGRVAYILIGGINFLLRHAPLLTYDVDLWIEDSPENLDRCEKALCDLQAEWGASEHDWGPVANKRAGWLRQQAVFCLTSPSGAIDVFRSVKGLEAFAACRARAQTGRTASGVPYVGLCDEDMLKCQLALPEPERDQKRIRLLRKAIGRSEDE
jgi:hypothetical protein